MSEKKMVRRSFAIALGIICIVLASGLVGALAYYVSLANDKDKAISMLNSQISQLTLNITNLQNQIASDNESTVLLDAQVFLEFGAFSANSSRPIILNNTITTQGIWSYTSQLLTKLVIDYSGYVVVNITQSDSNSTFVDLEYSSNGFDYDNTVNVGSRGSACFPVLPTNTLKILLGHTDYISGHDILNDIGDPIGMEIPVATVTIVYHY